MSIRSDVVGFAARRARSWRLHRPEMFAAGLTEAVWVFPLFAVLGACCCAFWMPRTLLELYGDSGWNTSTLRETSAVLSGLVAGAFLTRVLAARFSLGASQRAVRTRIARWQVSFMLTGLTAFLVGGLISQRVENTFGISETDGSELRSWECAQLRDRLRVGYSEVPATVLPAIGCPVPDPNARSETRSSSGVGSRGLQLPLEQRLQTAIQHEPATHRRQRIWWLAATLAFASGMMLALGAFWANSHTPWRQALRRPSTLFTGAAGIGVSFAAAGVAELSDARYFLDETLTATAVAALAFLLWMAALHRRRTSSPWTAWILLVAMTAVRLMQVVSSGQTGILAMLNQLGLLLFVCAIGMTLLTVSAHGATIRPAIKNRGAQ